MFRYIAIISKLANEDNQGSWRKDFTEVGMISLKKDKKERGYFSDKWNSVMQKKTYSRSLLSQNVGHRITILSYQKEKKINSVVLDSLYCI